jgi:exonuclease VII small subunit
MAIWADLKETRLKIADPIGVIDLLTVADATARLAVTSPVPQTAYRQESDDTYWTYDAALAAWERVDLELSDARLESLIDLWTAARAASRALKLILTAIGRRMGIARSQDGADSTTFQTLSDTYAFYKNLAESMEAVADESDGVSTGRFFAFASPGIAGGMTI